MGHAQSTEEKELKQREKLKKDREKYIYDRRKIGWDEFGNLRYGIIPKVKPSNQLKALVKLESEFSKIPKLLTPEKEKDSSNNAAGTAAETTEDPGTIWHVISAAWITSWLAYVHVDKGKSPSPGPCRNDHLIEWDAEHQKYIGRFGLQMSTKEQIGDYRRINKDSWELIQAFYPGSGPSITMELDASKSGARGFYDNSSWNVLDHPPPIDKSAQKKKKKRLLDLTGGFRKNITTSPETEAAEIDDNSGVANVNELAVKGGIDIKTQSKKDIKGGKYEAVGKMGEEEEEEEEEQDDESLEIEGEDAEDKRVPDSDDDDEFPEDDKDSKVPTQRSFQPKRNSVGSIFRPVGASRLYHENVIDHYENPRNVGSLDKKKKNVGTGLVGAPACGDVMKLQIEVDSDGIIVDAKFKTFGCGSAIASSSFATEWLKGKAVDECMTIKNSDIASHLKLPPVKLHCSMLAEDAVHAAIKDFKSKNTAVA